jgi:anaerobic selenocysteine-containing dehydrogenase
MFLQVAAVGTGAVAFSGCGGPNAFRVQSTVRMAEDDASANEAWYATACAECSAGCGVLVRVVEGRARKIEGNPDHPVNQGKLCARGQAALQAEYNPDRLRGPLAQTGPRGTLPRSDLSWDGAIQSLAQRLDAARGKVALITRPLGGHQAQLLDRFASGLGARWLRLETVNEEPLRAAVKRVFGQDVAPVFDLANAGCVVNFGADLLGGWLSPVRYSAAYGQFRQGRYRAGDFQPQNRPRGHLVHVGPRFSDAAAAADEWLPVKAGMEGLAALSLAQAIIAAGGGRGGAGEAFYRGAAALDGYSPDNTAGDTGIPAERIRKVAGDFMKRGPSLAIGGGAAGAHTNGADALAAVLGLNLLAGNVGKAGGVLFGSANPFSNAPARTAASGLQDWTNLAAQLRSGAIQAVLVYDANPAYELPSALGLRDALAAAPFLATFSAFPDETAQLADMVLPPSLPLEDWGEAVAETGSLVTFRQPILRPLYGSRSFGDALLDLGRRLNLGGWPDGTFQDVLRGAARGLPGSGGDFERFWTDVRAKGFWSGQAPAGASAAPSGSAVAWTAPQFAGSAGEYPLALHVFPHNSLGEGRAANLPWLQALPDPMTTVVWQTWVEVSPRLGFKEGDIVRVETPRGAAELPVYVSPAAPPDTIAIPLGQGHNAYGRYAEKRGVNPLDLLEPLAEAATGSLAYGATRARLVRTGRRMQLPKFEGDVPAYQIPGKEVLEVRYQGGS